METRVFGTGLGQNWRVTGLQAGDPLPDYPPHVRLEFWIGGPDRGWRYNGPDSLDPDLARLLAKHLHEMSYYAEEKNVTNLLRYFDTSSRTKHKSIKAVATSIEGLAEYLEEVLPEGSEKMVAMRKLLEAKDAACRSALDLPEE